jgi:hypothetical protein
MATTQAVDEAGYADIRDAQHERATTVRVTGIPIAAERERPSTMKGIQHCLCIQDSPDNPCPCTGPILWVPNDALLRVMPAGRRDDQGRALMLFIIRRDARLIVERPRTVRADLYAALVQARTRAHPRTTASVARIAGSQAGPAGAVVAAFMAGWKIGRDIDDMSGGEISDTGADIIGSAVEGATEIWDWLTN